MSTAAILKMLGLVALFVVACMVVDKWQDDIEGYDDIGEGWDG